MTLAFFQALWRQRWIFGPLFRPGSIQTRVFSRTFLVSSLCCLFDISQNRCRQSDIGTLYKYLHQSGDRKSASIHEYAEDVIYLALWREEPIPDIASDDPREAGRRSEEHFRTGCSSRGLSLRAGSHV